MLISPRVYETPESNTYLGTIIDVVDLGIQPNNYGGEPKRVLKIVWVLNANDSEGKPFRAERRVNVPYVLNEKSKLFETARDVFAPQVLPPGQFETEWFIGRSNSLYIKKEISAKGNPYANIVAIATLKAGEIPPVAPTNYVRAHLRPAQPTVVRAGTGQSTVVQFGAAQPAQVAQVPAAAPVQAIATQPVQPAPVAVADTVQPSVFVPNAAPSPVQAQAPQQPAPVKF